MKFRREPIKDYHLRDTSVENIFISEYMPEADANEIKVYLLALMCADSDEHLTNEMVGRQLGINEEDVLSAWSYWEERNVIKKHFDRSDDKLHYQVEFLSLKERAYGSQSRVSCEENVKKQPENLNKALHDDIIKKLFDEIEQITGRMFEGSEMTTIISWIDDFSLEPEAVRFAYEYCVSKRDNNKFRYISSIVRQWINDGLKTEKEIKAYLEETDNRRYLYKRVMKALGFHRSPSEAEERIMDRWFDDWGADINLIIEACAKSTGISNPNLNYINKVVAGMCGIKSGEPQNNSTKVKNPVAAVQKQYDELRNRNLKIVEDRKKKIYTVIPRIREIDEQLLNINKNLSREVLAGGTEAKKNVEQIRRSIVDLNGEKAYLLTENNYPADYLDVFYECKACKDTGILKTGERCRCFTEKLIAFQSGA